MKKYKKELIKSQEEKIRSLEEKVELLELKQSGAIIEEDFQYFGVCITIKYVYNGAVHSLILSNCYDYQIIKETPDYIILKVYLEINYYGIKIKHYDILVKETQIIKQVSDLIEERDRINEILKLTDEEDAKFIKIHNDNQQSTSKKRVGRPRKEKPATTKPKRPVGRPRKRR